MMHETKKTILNLFDFYNNKEVLLKLGFWVKLFN